MSEFDGSWDVDLPYGRAYMGKSLNRLQDRLVFTVSVEVSIQELMLGGGEMVVMKKIHDHLRTAVPDALAARSRQLEEQRIEQEEHARRYKEERRAREAEEARAQQERSEKARYGLSLASPSPEGRVSLAEDTE